MFSFFRYFQSVNTICKIKIREFYIDFLVKILVEKDLKIVNFLRGDFQDS